MGIVANKYAGKIHAFLRSMTILIIVDEAGVVNLFYECLISKM